MKRHLAILATLAALALPGLVEAREKTVCSPDAMASPEQMKMTPSKRASSVDAKALQEYFRTAPYRNGSFIGNN